MPWIDSCAPGCVAAQLSPEMACEEAWLLAGLIRQIDPAATLALGTLLSAGLGSRARVAGAAFLAWLVLVYLSDLGTIGLAVARGLGPGQVFALALLNPIQQARILGVLVLSQRLDVLGPVGIYGYEHFGNWGLAALLGGSLLATAALALGAGYLVFRKAIIP